MSAVSPFTVLDFFDGFTHCESLQAAWDLANTGYDSYILEGASSFRFYYKRYANLGIGVVTVVVFTDDEDDEGKLMEGFVFPLS